MFNFTSLLGAQSSSSASISLLELEGGVKILVDVGWDETFDGDLLKELEKHAPTISLILLTHATTSHLGAFAHCCKHFSQFKTIPVYATAPVISLGRALLQDIYASNPLAASTIPEDAIPDSTRVTRSASHILLQAPTNDEIAEYFALVRPLKFSQPHEPEAAPSSPSLNGLTITAYSAGHTLGGTIWHLQHGLESIVYAVDWNQAKESALQAAAWLGAGGTEVIESLRRPTALVCSSRSSQRVVFPGGRNKRDEHMIKLIKDTISNGGSVLIPSDTCGRSLELSYFLEEAWEKEKTPVGNPDSLRNANVYFASGSIGLTMRYARSLLEWMDDEIVREFEAAGQQGDASRQQNAGKAAPFDFKHVRAIERTKQIRKILAQDGPKVILASDLSLDWGYAQSVFEDFCSNNKNLVILPEPLKLAATGRESISHLLWNLWSQKSQVGKDEHNLVQVVDVAGQTVTYTQTSTEKLTEHETAVYQQYLAKERQKHWTLGSEQTSNLRTGAADAIDDNTSSSSDESEESDDEQQGKVLNVSATLSHTRHKAGLTDAELGIDILIRRKGHYDYGVRGKKGRERMFPILPAKRNQKFDDYGEIIRPEDFLRAEERENLNEQAAGKNDKDPGLGQKRKWAEIAQTNLSGKSTTNGTKKRKTDRLTDENTHTDSGYSTLGNGNEFEDESDDTDDEQEQKPEGPVKAVISKQSLAIQSRLAYVDFSGLHDRRSMQMLIPLIRPRKLVIVGGDVEETAALQTECEKLLGTGSVVGAETASEIFTPLIGETLNASVDTNAWNVKLSVPLRNTLRWQPVGQIGVVPLSGHLGAIAIQASSEQSKAKRVKGASDTPVKQEANEAEDSRTTLEDVETEPVLDVVPSAALLATRAVARPLHVGDIRLSDLRKLMQSTGIGAEFRGEGVLLVNGQVLVRKSAVGKIEVESVIGLNGYSVVDPTFDIVRGKIYSSLALISGSGSS